jgi:hypothetical protein
LIGRPALQGHGTTMHAVLFSAMHAANPRPDQRQSSNIVAIKCSHQSPDCSFLVVVRTYVRTYVERAYVPPSASARLCTGRMQTVRSTTTTTRRELDQRLIDLRQARTHGSCIFISDPSDSELTCCTRTSIDALAVGSHAVSVPVCSTNQPTSSL